MKKIYFNDRYGITTKAIHYRNIDFIVPIKELIKPSSIIDTVVEDVIFLFLKNDKCYISNYYTGEQLAVAMSYETIAKIFDLDCIKKKYQDTPGYTNKSYTKSDILPFIATIDNIRLINITNQMGHDSLLRHGISYNSITSEYYFFDDKTKKVISSKNKRDIWKEYIGKLYGRDIYHEHRYAWVYSAVIETRKEPINKLKIL